MKSFLENEGNSSALKGRVTHEDRNLLTVVLDSGEEIRATVAGSLFFRANTRMEMPTVGDYVECSYNPLQGIGRVEKLLPRESVLLRKVAGEHASEQVLGANLDTVFYLSSLNMDLNLRRMERYLIMIRDGGIDPVVIMTKADLIDEAELSEMLIKISEVVDDVPVFVTSIKDPESFKPLMNYFEDQKTVAFLGSSGVGKSSLTNVVLGKPLQEVQDIREDDDKGKHTTTARSLFRLDNGCFVMDTPGIREVQLWEGEVGHDEMFRDIAELETFCQFRNCRHGSEPGCAINEAIDSGDLCEDRYRSYLKLGREQAYMTRKANAKDLSSQKKIWKKRSVAARRGRQRSWKG